mmetsp:Transcript_39196/g.79168  ORF Transcript_39196/g.79168 Transcript_39196/m.79168 type:complete len:159 (-) Transcript_39196:1874-2350(-)
MALHWSLAVIVNPGALYRQLEAAADTEKNCDSANESTIVDSGNSGGDGEGSGSGGAGSLQGKDSGSVGGCRACSGSPVQPRRPFSLSVSASPTDTDCAVKGGGANGVAAAVSGGIDGDETESVSEGDDDDANDADTEGSPSSPSTLAGNASATAMVSG